MRKEGEVTMDTEEIRETFIQGIGTVRACVDCGCLISGGPTRCVCCVDRQYPNTRWGRIKKRVRWLSGIVVGWG